jgi:hypothetical protein
MPSEQNIWIQYSRENLAKQSKRSFPFVPGLFFLGLGMLVVFAPRLILAVIASVLLFIGALLCFLAWKFVQLQKRFAAMSKNMESRFQVSSFEIRPSREERGEPESKKIVFH